MKFTETNPIRMNSVQFWKGGSTGRNQKWTFSNQGTILIGCEFLLFFYFLFFPFFFCGEVREIFVCAWYWMVLNENYGILKVI